MKRLSSGRAKAYAIIVFILTFLVIFLLPGYTVTAGGLLLGIFFTTFIENKWSTLIAGLISILIILFSVLFFESEMLRSYIITQTIFRIALVFFAVLIVFYIKNLYRDLQFDKTHMTSLFENATEGILLTNNKGVIILVNPAAERIFQYKASELINKPIEVLIPQQYRHGHVKLREGFHKNPSDRQMGSGRDLNGVRKNGDQIPVEVSLSFYHHQNELFVIAFIVDITLRKQSESEMLKQQMKLEKVTNDIRKLNAQLEIKVEERTVILKEALQRLEQSQLELNEALDKERQLNEIKSRFVSMASHEFRTPLSTVLSSASLLSKYTTTETQAKRDRHISKIKDSVKHLNDILEDFLSLGMLDEGRVNISFINFNLPVYMNDLTEEMGGLLKNGQLIDFEHEGGEEICTDPKLLKNILINLLTNAIKFSDEGKPILLKTIIDDGKTTIIVKDSGIGISPEDQKHLFSSFFRGKNALNIQGTGLGLHIVNRYLKLLGGHIHLHSELNIGTTITIHLPVKKEYEISSHH